ncbi:hypothetical protein AJ79_01479 [Helicocarpus griseus UAMH5409]|uniref:Uncharacterized protein n=1 Tax=Helicocarpus griseus UAMH5409 TaxID=1447875 RepID=A0A2B7Y6J4_9EURO|nr:hypothetical protein AJ79_01479 [Helicocarpus griseus UAMH5409]
MPSVLTTIMMLPFILLNLIPIVAIVSITITVVIISICLRFSLVYLSFSIDLFKTHLLRIPPTRKRISKNTPNPNANIVTTTSTDLSKLPPSLDSIISPLPDPNIYNPHYHIPGHNWGPKCRCRFIAPPAPGTTITRITDWSQLLVRNPHLVRPPNPPPEESNDWRRPLRVADSTVRRASLPTPAGPLPRRIKGIGIRDDGSPAGMLRGLSRFADKKMDGEVDD